MKKSFTKKLLILLSFVLFACFVTSESINVLAYDDSNYEEAGINFLEAQIDLMGESYDYTEIIDSIPLYDEENEIIAKVLILDRNGFWDYVVLDFLIDEIDEFGFNQEDFLSSFYNRGNIYYAGLLSYTYKEDGQYRDLHGNIVEEELFLDTMSVFKSKAAKIPNEVNGSDGIISWTDLISSSTNGEPGLISRPDYGYIPGIYRYSVTGSGLSFFNQTTFNTEYNLHNDPNIGGTCGPTAMTNMFVYYEWLGFDNSLLNNSAHDTFERMIELSDWEDWTALNWYGNTKDAMKDYAEEQGYDYAMNTYFWGTDWDYIKGSIDADRPVYTYLNVGDWAHSVVTVGYEQYTHTYTVNEPYWFFGWKDNYVTYHDDYYYLRVIDGWSTSNDGRFVNYNDFYSTVKGFDFMIDE